MTKLDERLDVDFDLLFGEMPATPCEGSQHGKSPKHDEGPGTHYWLMNHDCWIPAGTIYVLCERKSQDLFDFTARYNTIWCGHCDGRMMKEEWITYVGPVGK